MKTKILIDNDGYANKKVMQFFSSLADETRLKILLGLIDSPKCVNKIYEFVGRDKMTLSAISHQLAKLEDTGIIISRKDGKEKIFQLSNDFCWCIIRDAFKHFNGEKTVECEACNKLKKKNK